MPAIDVTDDTFESAVLDRSADTVVVIDLWATWCGPCRTLGPILEKVVDESGGRAELVKIDVDANPRCSATFQVQSIPAVYAIHERKVVDSFLGALPETAVRAWLDRVAPPPSEADTLVGGGDEASLREALALEPDNEAAVLGLSRLLVEQGTDEARAEALSLLARIPETPESRHLAAQARIGEEAEADVTAKLDGLLDQVKADPAARQEYLDLLEVLGPDDPRTAQYRKALSSRLF